MLVFTSTAVFSQEFKQYKAPLYTKDWFKADRYPDRISLTFSGDPATSFAVTWRTDTTVTIAYAEIAKATSAPHFWRTSTRHTAESETMDARHIANAQIVARFHSITFESLEPNTLYAYRVGDGEVWSEWIQYRTASSEAEPFSFLYVGDTQNQIMELWSRLIREGYRNEPDARFIIHAGDLVNRAHKDSEWHEWFEAGGWIHSMLPAMPVPGNHEYNEYNPGEEDEHISYQWRYQFTLPENGPEGLEESVYYVDYQGVRIVGLNSSVDRDRQAEWLDKVLADNPNTWTVLTFHHPVFSASHGRNNETLREQWKPVIDKYNVDLVLQGHDHTYARGNTLPAEAENQLSGLNTKDATGTVYVVSVSGGKMYSLKPEAWENFEADRKRAAENTQLFQQITVSGDTLTYKSFTATRELYDAFMLIKEPGGPNRMVEIENDRVEARRFDNTIAYDNPVVIDFEHNDEGRWEIHKTRKGFDVVHGQARSGEHAARFSLAEESSLFITDPHEARFNTTTWYGFSTWIPKNMMGKEAVIAKWTGKPDNQFEKTQRPPALLLTVQNGMLVAEGNYDKEFESAKSTIKPAFVKQAESLMVYDSWNDIVVKVKWMYDQRGEVTVWVNGKEVITFKGSIGYNDDDGPVFHLGIESDNKSDRELMILHDSYRRGSSFNDVNPAKFDKK